MMRGLSPRSAEPGLRSFGGVTSAMKIWRHRPVVCADVGDVKDGVRKLFFEHARLDIGGKLPRQHNIFDADQFAHATRASATASPTRRPPFQPIRRRGWAAPRGVLEHRPRAWR